MTSGLATSSASSIGTRGCTFHQVPGTCSPSGCLNCLKPVLLLQWEVLHVPCPCLFLLRLGKCSWNAVLMKIDMKMFLSTSAFSMSQQPGLPFSFGEVPHFPQSSFLSLRCLQKLFLLSLTSPVRFNSTRALAFLILAAQTSCMCVGSMLLQPKRPNTFWAVLVRVQSAGPRTCLLYLALAGPYLEYCIVFGLPDP